MYRVLHTVVPPLAKAVWRPTVTGLEHVPRTGGVILASNHLSFADSVVIPVVVPRKVVFLAKSDYFDRHRRHGCAVAGLVRGARDAAGRPRRPAGRAGQPRHRARRARPGRGVRHLPRGHPLARRPPLPRPHRRRPPGADRRCPGRPGGPASAPRTSSRSGRGCPASSPSASTFGAPIDFAGRFDGVPLGRARRVADRRGHVRDPAALRARSKPVPTTTGHPTPEISPRLRAELRP